MERDIDTHPFTPEERRVAEYLSDLTGIGAGDDPIGFLIASHRTLGLTVTRLNKTINAMDKELGKAKAGK